MAALPNNVLQLDPMMKQPIPLHTTMDGLNVSSPISLHTEAELRLSNDPLFAKVLPNIKSQVSPLEISQKVLEPRVLKVSKNDIQLLAIMLQEGRHAIVGNSQKLP
jgi:hypothetical protein